MREGGESNRRLTDQTGTEGFHPTCQKFGNYRPPTAHQSRIHGEVIDNSLEAPEGGFECPLRPKVRRAGADRLTSGRRTGELLVTNVARITKGKEPSQAPADELRRNPHLVQNGQIGIAEVGGLEEHCFGNARRRSGG